MSMSRSIIQSSAPEDYRASTRGLLAGEFGRYAAWCRVLGIYCRL